MISIMTSKSASSSEMNLRCSSSMHDIDGMSMDDKNRIRFELSCSHPNEMLTTDLWHASTMPFLRSSVAAYPEAIAKKRKKKL